MILLAIATLVGVVNASVFVYYPIGLTVSPQQPPVVFREGSNAGGKDLWGKTITVNIEDSGTALNIKVHPTLQRNYYYDIAWIVNLDSENAYFIKLRVVQAITDPRVSAAYLLIVAGHYRYMIDLKSATLQPDDWIVLGASGSLRVDLYLVLKGHSGGDIEASVDLIITTTQTSETPPIPPS